MCGRYAATKSPREVARLLDAEDVTGNQLHTPDFNVAPTRNVPAVLVSHGRRELMTLRWGLVPSWAKDLRIGNRMINARVETVTEKPAFRVAFKRRRCLLPADGYYEWQQIDGRKQPFYLTPADGSLLVMAGLYEIWHDAENVTWWTTTVITTEAADDLGHIHDRTPMRVPPAHWASWLDPAYDDPRALLQPAVTGELRAIPVSDAVNNVRNNGPELLAPVH